MSDSVQGQIISTIKAMLKGDLGTKIQEYNAAEEALKKADDGNSSVTDQEYAEIDARCQDLYEKLIDSSNWNVLVCMVKALEISKGSLKDFEEEFSSADVFEVLETLWLSDLCTYALRGSALFFKI